MDTNLPTRAYKYMDPKYLKMLRETGNIRLSYLESYDESLYGSEIGDDNEGIMRSTIYLDEYEVIPGVTTKKERDILGAHGLGFSADSGGILKNVHLSTSFLDTNYFVLCVCLNNNPKLKNEFGKGLQRINNFPQFIKGLTFSLNQKDIHLQDMGECIYLPKREQEFDASHLKDKGKNFVLHKPYLVKDKKYSYQKEYRVLWKYGGDKKITEPIILNDVQHLSAYYETFILQSNGSGNKNKSKRKKKK